MFSVRLPPVLPPSEVCNPARTAHDHKTYTPSSSNRICCPSEALHRLGLEALSRIGRQLGGMASNPAQVPKPNLDRYVVIHVATTCDEHGVYVTRDSAEVIELGWILLDANSCEEVRRWAFHYKFSSIDTTKASSRECACKAD